jgi:predicted Ser/Thr protein kinase
MTKRKRKLYNLKNSAIAYKLLRGQEGFGKIYWYGNQGIYNFLILEYLGSNLKELQNYVHGKFSLETTY